MGEDREPEDRHQAVGRCSWRRWGESRAPEDRHQAAGGGGGVKSVFFRLEKSGGGLTKVVRVREGSKRELRRHDVGAARVARSENPEVLRAKRGASRPPVSTCGIGRRGRSDQGTLRPSALRFLLPPSARRVVGTGAGVRERPRLRPRRSLASRRRNISPGGQTTTRASDYGRTTDEEGR